MNEQPKRMSITEFREKGYLQELNRQFLHPLGMALEVIVDGETGKESFGGVWDYRDDPEGLLFSSIDLVDAERAIRICDEMHIKRVYRLRKYGWAIQPLNI